MRKIMNILLSWLAFEWNGDFWMWLYVGFKWKVSISTGKWLANDQFIYGPIFTCSYIYYILLLSIVCQTFVSVFRHRSIDPFKSLWMFTSGWSADIVIYMLVYFSFYRFCGRFVLVLRTLCTEFLLSILVCTRYQTLSISREHCRLTDADLVAEGHGVLIFWLIWRSFSLSLDFAISNLKARVSPIFQLFASWDITLTK